MGDDAPQGDPNGNGQNTATLLGKILRINPRGTLPGQYSIPADNPFTGGTPGADEIYSYGFRNPWRFSFDRLTGDLTIGDVGNDSVEEVNFTPKGPGAAPISAGTASRADQPSSADASGLHHAAEPDAPGARVRSTLQTGAAAVTGGYVIRDGALPSLLGRYIYADIFGCLRQ